VPVAVKLILVAVTEQRHRPAFAKRLEKPQGELLAVVFDCRISLIDGSALAQLVAITAAEYGPSNFARLEFFEQGFAPTEIRHPNSVACLGQATASKARRQNSQSVFVPINRRMDAFGSDHST
jgi:hypothetical protein